MFGRRKRKADDDVEVVASEVEAVAGVVDADATDSGVVDADTVVKDAVVEVVETEGSFDAVLDGSEDSVPPLDGDVAEVAVDATEGAAAKKKKKRRFGKRKARGAQSEAHDQAVAHLLAPVPRADRFNFQDLVAEATADIGSRPGRLLMTIVGTVLGIGALVSTIGFAQTMSGQIASQFDAVSATQVTIKPAEAQRGGGGKTATIGALPWDSADRVKTLVGVVSATLIADVALPEGSTITALPLQDPSKAPKAAPDLVATGPDLLDALRAKLVTGRMFDEGHDDRGDRVAVLGAGAAETLNVTHVNSQPSIFIDGIPYAVIGIVDDFQRRSDLRDTVIIPLQSAVHDFNVAAPGELQIQIKVGAGKQVASQAVVALSPNDPEKLKATAPADRSDLANNVQADVNFVFLILGGIVLLAGALGIANVTLLNVTERVGEIGLRRALGATRRQISSQFMLESVVIGLVGGLMGASLGVLSIVIVSVTQGWTPVVDPLVAVAGTILGALVGWGAGWYPARRAARVEPVTALRGA